MSFFDSKENKLPLYRAVEFYKHQNNWSNRFIAGDSLIVMNSLLEKEGMGGKIQMVYIDPPYGKNYASNFQAFVCKQNVRDKDEDLSQEAETILAFRDTWELEIHSFLTYLHNRIKLAQKMLTSTGSCFVQISIENMHLVRSIMDEIFGAENFISIISYRTRGALRSKHLPKITDYVIWYAKDISQVKFKNIFVKKDDDGYDNVELDGKRRKMSTEEMRDRSKLPKHAKIYRADKLTSTGHNPRSTFNVEFEGKIYSPGSTGSWVTNKIGMSTLIKKQRVVLSGNSLRYVYYYDDHPVKKLTNVWLDTQGATNKKYVVQTADKIIQRCMLMTTDPGDLVFDPTCGSGTTAFIAEKFGRRWITCDTSRIAITVAKQRIMTSVFEYYKLANNESSKNEIQNGFEYEQVAHLTLEQVAHNEPGGIEMLFDKPKIDKSKQRISGPFTVEAVPAPTVQSIDVLYYEHMNKEGDTDDTYEESEARSMQQQWREELAKTGIKGKNKQKIEFSVVNTHPTTRYIHAIAITKEATPQRVAISFGPTHAPLNQRQVETALEEARGIQPKVTMIIFTAMHFDPEASKNIEKTDWEGITILKAEMNKDLITSDLKKARSSNESFWLIGQPDVGLETKRGKYVVKINGFDYFNTKTNKLESSDTKKIVLWMLDTDYDGRSIYPQQLFFPMKNSTGSKGLQKLAKTLHGSINEELLVKFLGKESIPFEAGDNRRIAIKIIDDRGIESLKIIELK